MSFVADATASLMHRWAKQVMKQFQRNAPRWVACAGVALLAAVAVPSTAGIAISVTKEPPQIVCVNKEVNIGYHQEFDMKQPLVKAEVFGNYTVKQTIMLRYGAANEGGVITKMVFDSTTAISDQTVTGPGGGTFKITGIGTREVTIAQPAQQGKNTFIKNIEVSGKFTKEGADRKLTMDSTVVVYQPAVKGYFTFTGHGERKVSVLKLDMTGPDDVVLGDQFTLKATVTPGWSGNANIAIDSGTAYSSVKRAETYWDAAGNTKNTPQYEHEFGIGLPSPATFTINNGTGSFCVTQFKMEPFQIKISLQGIPNCAAVYAITKEHCWARVTATYIGKPNGPESTSDSPGFFDDNKQRAALPYGSQNLFNSWIVLKKALSGGTVNAKIRDRGPWFPYKTAYPAGNSWYNDYWADGGWPPLSEDMMGLRRVGEPVVKKKIIKINGSGLDLTKKAITDLDFSYNKNWSGTVYWRMK